VDCYIVNWQGSEQCLILLCPMYDSKITFKVFNWPASLEILVLIKMLYQLCSDNWIAFGDLIFIHFGLEMVSTSLNSGKMSAKWYKNHIFHQKFENSWLNGPFLANDVTTVWFMYPLELLCISRHEKVIRGTVWYKYHVKMDQN